MPNCKPGDLAILIRDECPENLGAIVEVLAPWVDDGRGLPGVQWCCRAKGRPLMSMQWAAYEGYPPFQVGYRYSAPGQQLAIADEDLRPITGLPDADDVVRELDKPLEVNRA